MPSPSSRNGEHMGGETLHVELFVPPRQHGGTARVDASFEVPPGITVLFGPSGAGKSTCLAAIAGLLRPSRGSIRLDDELFTDTARRIHVAPHRRRVALVFQSLALFPHMSVERNVAYGISKDSSAERTRHARAWLERTRVGHLAEGSASTLSGGEAQRVALARALASEPRVLLLDEPFSALDFALRRELGQEVEAIVRELALPTILVTHDRDDAVVLGHRMVVMSSGKVVAVGRPEDVLRAMGPTEATRRGAI